MPSMPVISIVGRPNVGKSSLLNALTGKRISIVQDQPGVTRDRLSIPLQLTAADGSPRFAELVDTGGYGFEDPDQLGSHIQRQIELAMKRANVVIFLVDAQAGLTGGDEQIAQLLRRLSLKVILVANKIDGPRLDAAVADFARLGFGTPIGVSALNGRNIDELLEVLGENLDLTDAPRAIPEPHMMIAIVGKRNAGKSTLVNAIARLHEGDPERVIVSEIPGTTRDSIDVRFEKDGQSLVVIDTAGVRKKRQMVTHDIEFYSFHRAQRSIRRADVVLMLIDGTERVSEPDKQLARYIADQYKPVVLVINKWDLVLQNAKRQAEQKQMGFSEELLAEEFSVYLNQELRHVDWAPMMFISAQQGTNVQETLDVSADLFRQARTRVGTGELNRAVRQVFEGRAPATPTGRRIKVYYVTQTDVAPPAIVLFLNHPRDVTEDYKRFMVNRFRELLPFSEVPIKLVIRGRAGAPTDAEPIEAGQERAPRRKKPAVTKRRVVKPGKPGRRPTRAD